MSEISDKMRENNGSFVRTETSTHACTLWYIPGGIEYHLARSVVVFFDSEDDAKNFNRVFCMPPEICETYPLKQQVWDKHFSMAKYDDKGIFTETNFC